MQKKLPELLAPAGRTASLRAAIKGGANAVYLGLQKFNARGRANNFQDYELASILQEAHRHHVKIFITLNTVIKNNELRAVIQLLDLLDKARVDAVIIQDWGIFKLAKTWFPKLNLHASTQMACHNSGGVIHSGNLGFKRVVLARELTLNEIKTINQKKNCELELFIHGALCYSFSGQCYFSSFIGGRGANRGLCSQPCRMQYQSGAQKDYLFSLKDNEQINQISEYSRIGIDSLKIEGRMKSADYVYQVTKAYRLALDQPERTDEAKELLSMDFGREKTSYFAGGNLKNALAHHSETGLLLGKIIRIQNNEIQFYSAIPLLNNDRVRVSNQHNGESQSLQLDNLWEEKGCYSFTCESAKSFQAGDDLFLIGRKQGSFPSRLQKVKQQISPLNKNLEQKILKSLSSSTGSFDKKSRLFLRIDHSDWLNYREVNSFNDIILSFPRKMATDFNYQKLTQTTATYWLELPKFIAEKDQTSWKELLANAKAQNINHFMLSHLSQTMYLPSNSTFACNEQIYVFNDAAARFLEEQHSSAFCYPLESDFKNLLSMNNHNGIVVLHSSPELFFSRMPIRLENSSSKFKNKSGDQFNIQHTDGITITTPSKMLNLFSQRTQLEKTGFHRFMIDLKHETPNSRRLKQIMNCYSSKQAIPNSILFNFKRTLS